MSMTQGPWKFEHLPSKRGEDWTVLSIGGLTVEAPSAFMYVACHQDDQRALEAIPDLVEALKEAITPLDLYHAYGWPDRAGVRDKIRAALNKAGVTR